MTADTRSAPLRVLDVEFNPTVRSLEAAGRKTVLDSRSFSVFVALSEHLGDCVSKEELLRAAWPNQLVHENSLAKAISKLRQAIRGSQLEIVAAYGVGYVLREVPADHLDAVDDVTPPEPVAPAAKSLGSKGRMAAFASVALLAMLAVAAGVMVLASASDDVAIRDTAPITHDAPDAVATILWVDDHPSNNQLEVAAFKKRRIAVHLAQSTEDALKLMAMNRYQLLISDLGRGDDRLAGLKMTEAIRKRGIAVPVVIYTVRPEDRAGQEAQRRMITEAGAELAVTPQEVRATVLNRLAPTA